MPDRAVRRRVLSQNFLVDRRAIEGLVDGSGVGEGDLVLDIGAGNGLISGALDRENPGTMAGERAADQAIPRADVDHQIAFADAGTVNQALYRAAVDEEVLAQDPAPDGSVRHGPSVPTAGR